MPEGSYYAKLSDLFQKLVRSLHANTRRYSFGKEVSFSALRVLFLLRSGKPVEMGTIKKGLSITGAFATVLVDRLVEHKLLERQRDNKDRRRVTVALTDKGKHYLAKFEAHRKQLFRTLVAGLKEEDKEIMEKGISILVDSLESMKNFNL